MTEKLFELGFSPKAYCPETWEGIVSFLDYIRASRQNGTTHTLHVDFAGQTLIYDATQFFNGMCAYVKRADGCPIEATEEALEESYAETCRADEAESELDNLASEMDSLKHELTRLSEDATLTLESIQEVLADLGR